MTNTIHFDGYYVDASLTATVDGNGVSWSGSASSIFGGSASGSGANGHGQIQGSTLLGNGFQISW